MARKTESLSIRVPAELRHAIEWGAKQEGKSQSDFMLDSVLELVDKLERSEPLEELILPDSFKIPKGDVKMVTIRLLPEKLSVLHAYAPRFYHSATRMVLWASAQRAYNILATKQENSD